MKRWLEAALDRIQPLVPEALRKRFRRYYLRCFFFPLFPEKKPTAAATSSLYPPCVKFKKALYRGFPLDLSGLDCYCRRGLVSVVLPVYNQHHLVRAAVESVLSQTYSPIELLIVDDGSTDRTPAVLREFIGHPGVRILRQPNQKLPRALTAGFHQAQGEFYTWISADNEMMPNQIAEQVRFLRSRPDVDFVYADEVIIDEAGRPFLNSGWCREFQNAQRPDLIHWPRDPGRLNFEPSNYIGACFLYRAWVGKIIGPYAAELFTVEDYDYWMRINALFRIAHIGTNVPLHRYRLHRHSLTARYEELKVFDKVQELLALDNRRRQYLLEAVEIRLTGSHRWFRTFERMYRLNGHPVVLADGAPDQSPRCCSKRLNVIALAEPQWLEPRGANGEPVHALNVHLVGRQTDNFNERTLGNRDWLLATDRATLRRLGPRFAHRLLFAPRPETAAYPLIALLNSQVIAEAVGPTKSGPAAEFG